MYGEVEIETGKGKRLVKGAFQVGYHYGNWSLFPLGNAGKQWRTRTPQVFHLRKRELEHLCTSLWFKDFPRGVFPCHLCTCTGRLGAGGLRKLLN